MVPNKAMTSLERVQTALGFQEPDRVPMFLDLTIIGARELDLSIKQYFSSPDHVVKGQLLMKEKYNNDMVTNFLYSSAETEAWGGETVFYENGPPNTGEPLIKDIEDINKLTVPNINNSPSLLKGLEIIKKLQSQVQGETPIIGSVTAPFSLPVLQLGFEKYLEVLYFRTDLLNKLMQLNVSFCAAWANAQLKAGATAVGYANPLASPTIIERNTYLEKGFPVDSRTISKINGSTATKLASGIATPVIDDLANTGTKGLVISSQDDIAEAKRISNNRMAIMGNLNAIEMINWDSSQIITEVKQAISKGAPGGGFILCDNHGEIPWQVSEKTLLEIAKAVREYGKYPIDL